MVWKFLLCISTLVGILLTSLCIMFWLYIQNKFLKYQIYTFAQQEKQFIESTASLRTENNLLKSQLDMLSTKLNTETIEHVAENLCDSIHNKQITMYCSLWENAQNNITQAIDKLQVAMQEKHAHDLVTQDSLKSTFTTLANNTNALLNTIKGTQSHRGFWGEHVLYKILTEAGLIENQDYFIQKTMTIDTEGQKPYLIRPDVIIKLPQNKCLAIDAKTSFIEQPADDQAPDMFIEKTAKNYIRHIKEMCTKNYPALIDGSLDFMIIFIPFDDLFLHIQQHVPNIVQIANKANIAIASPSIIVPLLKMVEQSQQYEHNKSNLETIIKEIQNLIPSIKKCEIELTLMGKLMDRTQTQFEKIKKIFFSGNKALINRLSRIEETHTAPSLTQHQHI